ncbi:MAG: glycosyltransferase [bacterium]
MDEILTSPTCSQSVPLLSIVIPAYNAAADLNACLDSLIGQIPVSHEIIVIDDASTDDTAEVARQYGVRLFQKSTKSGPASCRNWGVHEARGHWVFFIDADVTVHRETIARALSHLKAKPALVALFGSYDDRPHDPGLVSQFRNLLHHHVHQSGQFAANLKPAHTFWTGCGFIRRDIFLQFGGFDYWRYKKPAIEDIEFGYRLSSAGHAIGLARDVLCKHRKRWTLRSMVRTDFMQRGLPWSLLLLRSGQKSNDLNVDRRQKIAALGAAIFWLGLALSLVLPALGFAVSAAMIAQMYLLNRSFYQLLHRCGGIRLALAGLPLMHLYYLVCLSSYATAIGIWLLVDRLKILPGQASQPSSIPAPHLAVGQHESPRHVELSRHAS